MDGRRSTFEGSCKNRNISRTAVEALQGRRDYRFRNGAPSRSAFTWTRSHAGILVLLGIISQVSLIQASETRASGLEKRAAGNSPNFVNDPSLTRAVAELVTEFSSGGKNPSPEKVAQYKAALSRCVSSISGSVLGRRPTCPVSITTLTTVKDEIRNALSGVGSPNTNDCVPNFEADRCEEYIKVIQCGVNHMRNGFLRATSSNAMTVRQAEKWRNEYYKLYERHQRDIDNVKQSVSDEYKLQIDSLKTTMHALQQQIERYAERIKHYGPEVIANRIRDGQISSAKAAFEELKKEFSIPEDRLISQILDNAYDLNQLERTVEFIEAIPSCAQEETGYQALIALMAQRGHSGSPEILIVSKGANSGCSLSSGLKGNINSRVEAVIGAWAQRISSGNYDQIKDFARNHAESFRHNLVGRLP